MKEVEHYVGLVNSESDGKKIIIIFENENWLPAYYDVIFFS